MRPLNPLPATCRHWLFGLLALLLAGCAPVGPDHQPPALELPAGWSRSPDHSRTAVATALARITCDAAAVLGVEGGTLAVGAPADVCLFDAQDTWRVQPEALKSRGKNTPFLGYVMEGRAQATLVAGRIVFDALDR